MRAPTRGALSLGLAGLLLGLGGFSALRAQDAGGDPYAVKIEVQEHVCENGLRVLVSPRAGAPRVACSMWFRVGSVDELPGKTGLAHVLEHMMFKGSHRIGVKDYARGEEISQKLDDVWERRKTLVAALGAEKVAQFRELRGKVELLEAKAKKKGADDEDLDALSEARKALEALDPKHECEKVLPLDQEFQKLLSDERGNDKKEELWDLYVQAGGTGLNAFTTEDTTNYVVTLPSNKLELFFWLESDRLADPNFREWYPERDVVEEERRIDENAPDGAFYEGLAAVAYGPHPYGHPILGWMADLDELTREDAYDFYRRHYSPSNATCVLVGDVNPARIFEMADRYLGKVARRAVSPRRPPAEPTSPGEKRLLVESEAEPRVELWYRTPPPGTRDRDVLDVIAALLSGETGRLHRHLVDEQGLALTVDASDEVKRYAARFKVTAHAKPDGSLLALEAALDAEVASLVSESVTQEELDRAKERIAAEHVHGLEDLEQTCEKLGSAAAVQGDWRRALDRTTRVREVTADDVKRVAALVFRADRRTTGVLRRPGMADEAAPESPDKGDKTEKDKPDMQEKPEKPGKPPEPPKRRPARAGGVR